MKLEWAAQLLGTPGVEPVMTAGALLAPGSAMSPDHLVRLKTLHGRFVRQVCRTILPSV